MKMKLYADDIRPIGQNHDLHIALMITLAGNVVLAIIKFLTAKSFPSSALLADAYNSISDVMYSSLLVFGIAMANRPADLSHPQGHRRFEPMVGLIISFAMAWAGYEAVSGAIDKFKNGFDPIPFGIPSIVLLISASIKFFMYLSVNKISKKISSPTLTTAAKDNLLDTITSFAAIIGICGAHFIHPLCDPIAGILVSFWIFKAAYSALAENFGYLTGHGISQERLDSIQKEIMTIDGVLNVHQIFAEYVGTKLLLDVHVNVDGSKTLNEVHGIETQIEHLITASPDIERIYVHAEPPEYS